MKKCIGMLTFSIGIAVICAKANPISHYDLPMFSEFQSSGNIDWIIELGGNGGLRKIIACPCTTSRFSLRINSSGEIFKTQLSVNSTGIALLTRNSIVDAPQETIIAINRADTVQLLDSMWNDSSCSECFWQCVVHPVKPGNSLAICADGSTFETTRPSIGSIGNYTTSFQIVCMDSLKNPIPDVEVFRMIIDPYLPMQTLTFGFTDNDGILCCIEVNAGCDGENRGGFFLQKNGYQLIGGSGLAYIDTAAYATDTVFFEKSSGTNQTVSSQKSAAARFSAVYQSKHKITLVVVASKPIIDNPRITIYDLSGKTIASLEACCNVPGTHLFVWNDTQAQQQAGVLVCRLIVSGQTIASKTLTVY
ncbi:MAG: hypothetical protein JW863_13600 [Chitinispirillaceae bacterium]|nr:hypothetical protein [Chitinispirillaceae bacterium]